MSRYTLLMRVTWTCISVFLTLGDWSVFVYMHFYLHHLICSEWEVGTPDIQYEKKNGNICSMKIYTHDFADAYLTDKWIVIFHVFHRINIITALDAHFIDINWMAIEPEVSRILLWRILFQFVFLIWISSILDLF